MRSSEIQVGEWIPTNSRLMLSALLQKWGAPKAVSLPRATWGVHLRYGFEPGEQHGAAAEQPAL